MHNLTPTQSHDEDDAEEETKPDIAATLLRHSHRHYESTLYLNLHEKHFSYIKDLPRYSKSFRCSRCGKYWKGANKLRRHVPLSVSVYTNVPEYQEPKCFVSNGDPKEMITEFIEYLVSISTKSSSLLQEQYAPVFEALNHAAVSSRGETHEDQLAKNARGYAKRKCRVWQW